MSETKIERFIGDFAFLSNFHPSTISHRGKLWATVEAAYQAMKTVDPEQQETIRKAKSAAIAKKLGRTVTIRPDWENVKVEVMRELVREKFKNPLLREMLLATDGADLIETNYWNDSFWGVCRGHGQNWLGRILMETRAEILAEVTADATLHNINQ